MNTNHTTPNVFPAISGLEVFDMITVMADRTGEHYTAMNLNYRGKGGYLTLVPCDPNSSAPQIKVERNMWGAYILNHDFSYSAKAQNLFASHIAMMEEVEEIAANAWNIWDYEGFAVTLNIAPIVAAIVAPVAAPAAQDQPAPRVIITPVVIIAGDGRFLTAAADGWVVESSSKPGTFHETSADGSKCSCEGSYWHGKCWHRTAVKTHNAPRKHAAPVSRPRRNRRTRFNRMFK